MIAGYEISTRIGVALGRSHYRYWHNSGTVGTFGAASAAGVALALDAPNPVTLTPDSRAIDALREMSNRGFRHLPIVESGRIWGVVSRNDFMGMEIDRLDEEDHLWECIR